MERPDVVVVGAGLAGLCCALHLQESGLSPLVVEASVTVGGRIRTDRVDGFLLDRGFQVLLTSYPEAHRMLDSRSLGLAAFEPGALVRFKGRFHRVVDPRRRRWAGLRTLLAPVGTFGDKLRVRALRADVTEGPADRLFDEPETTALEALRSRGFTEAMIDRFFRPFLGGVFLERELRTSSRMLRYVFRMFAQGDATLPAEGMEAIPRQLASHLDEGTVRTGAKVESVRPGAARLVGGEEIEARAVVVATEGPEAARLLPRIHGPGSCSVRCLYFEAPEPPIAAPILVLDGEGTGPVQDLCVPSAVQPSYAPAGAALVSASVVGPREEDDATLEKAVRAQLEGWFGAVVKDWRHLRSYRIDHALPAQAPGWLEPPERPVCVDRGLFVCGDHRDHASIQGAMVSGRRAAEAVLADLGGA